MYGSRPVGLIMITNNIGQLAHLHSRLENVSTVVFASLQGGPIAVIAVASGILVDFIWKYAASSRFVWNVPY